MKLVELDVGWGLIALHQGLSLGRLGKEGE